MKSHGPWKIKSSEVKYKNPWMEVREDQVVRPDGKDGIYGTLKLRPGASVLPLDNEGNVYLIKEFHYGLGYEGIQVAGGGLDDNEEPLKAAQRELAEELGITATEWIDLARTDLFTGYLNGPVYLFLARQLTLAEHDRDSGERMTVIKLPFSEAIKMVMTGEITDGGSCVLLLKAAAYLGRL